MNPNEVRELVAFNAWANHKVLERAELLSIVQFTKPMGSSFSSVRDTLAHIYGVEWVWLERLQGRSPRSLPEASEFEEIKGLRERWEELEKRMGKYVSELSQTVLDEEVDYQTLSFGASRNPRWQMIQHMVNHGSYHRGQVVTLLRQLGAQAVGTDLITFYRERRAARPT